MDTDSRFIHFDDKTVFVRQRLKQAPAIVFIHGNSMSSLVWEKQWQSKTFAPFSLVAFDLVGHGQSSYSKTPESDYSLAGYASFIQSVIFNLELDNYIIVSHSLGANASIEALPGLAGCAGIAFTGITPIAGQFNPEKVYLPHPALSTFFKASATDEEVQAVGFALMRPNAEPPVFVKEDYFKTDPNARVYLSQSVLAGKIPDQIQILHDQRIPMLIIYGVGEQILNNDYLISLNLLCWKGKPQSIPQAGHLPQWENPEAYNTLIRSFISSIF